MSVPNPLLARAAGFTMVLGFVFLVIGNDPVVDEVFGTTDSDVRFEAIVASPDAWDRAWLWFGIAVIPAAVGLVMWAVAVGIGNSTSQSTKLAAVGAAAALAGALLWIYVCYGRATHAPEDIAADPNIAWWTGAFAPLMTLAVILLGIVLRRMGMTKRGWAVVVLGVVATPICFILPLLVPIVTAIVGAVLVLTRPSDWATPDPA